MRRSPIRKTAARIRPQSKKRAATAAERRRMVAEAVERFPWCVRCRVRPTSTLHEPLKRSRRPGSHLDPLLTVPSCDWCNEWAERSPAAATAEGWLIPSWTPYEVAVEITQRWSTAPAAAVSVPEETR